jgi:H+/Cl- antiporter ClcA
MNKDQARQYVFALLAAALIGLPVSAAVVVFTSVVHDLTTWIWTDIPHDLSFSEPPWWYVLLVPTLAGLLVAGALRLPGRGGHSPADGLSFEPAGPKLAASSVLAAGISLSFGLVLGPEAPLVAIGLALGVVAGRLAGGGQVMGAMVALAGGFAAISTVLGGPLASSLLLFEALATSGKFPSTMLGRILLPGLVAAGVGNLIFTGVAGWSGVHESELSIPGLPHYGSVRLVDIPLCLLVAVVASAFTLAARRLGSVTFHRVGGRLPVLLAGGLLVGAIAVIFRALADKPIDLVLFSGETATPAALAQTSVAVLVGVLFAKALAYAVSIGAGFRGGPIFPAVFLGVSTGVLASIVFDDLSVTAAVAAGVAAAGSAALRAPFFGALLSALLVGSAGTNAIPLAILASALAWLIAMAVNPAPDPQPEVKQGPAPDPTQGGTQGGS